jgi:hypothetical protein
MTSVGNDPDPVSWGYGWACGRSGRKVDLRDYPEWIDPASFEQGVRDGEAESPFTGLDGNKMKRNAMHG